MEEIITFSTIIAVGFSLLCFLAKQQFNDIKNGIRSTDEHIRENEQRVNERIDKLEEKTNDEIGSIKKEINDIKGDFATTFVLREDFFRAMNGVENNIRETGRKVDKILILMGDKNGGR